MAYRAGTLSIVSEATVLRATAPGALRALEAATRAIAAELDLDRVLQLIADQVRDLVAARYAALGIVGSDGRIERFITSGISAEERAAIGPVPTGHGLLGTIIRDAYGSGVLDPPAFCPPPPDSFAPDAGRLREALLTAVPDDVVARALAAWASVFGIVSFELSGQFENVVTERAAFYDHTVGCLGRLIGLPG